MRYYPQLLLAILAFTFLTRMYRLYIPQTYMFDEVYHAVTAKLMVDGDERAYEWNNPPPEPNTAVDWLHPPYAKLMQATAMTIFGKTSFGWRFSSVIFGCLVVWVTAKLAEELFLDKRLAVLAAFLVSLDGLVFTMSRIAMNDIHLTFFVLLSMWQYVRYIRNSRHSKKALILSGIAAGFAVGTKWSGVFAIGFIGIVESIYTIKTVLNTKKLHSKLIFLRNQIGLLFITCLVIPVALYLASYSQMFLLGKNFQHLIEMHKNTWWYQTHLTATHPAQARPIQWFLNTKPVWLAVKYQGQKTRADIYAVGNPALFWLGDIAVFASVFALIQYKIQNKKGSVQMGMLALLLLAYALVWLPWQLSPRIMFFYHYLPAVPLLAINLSFWLTKLWHIQKYRFWAASAVAVIFICFVILYPHLTLIPVPIEWKENIYFFFDFWKQA